MIVNRNLRKVHLIPRSEEGKLYTCTTRSIYFEHCRRRGGKFIGQKEYSNIIRDLNERIWDVMIRELIVFSPSVKLGSFYIVETFTNNGFRIDWKKTNEVGKMSFSYNFHTNGRRFMTKWQKSNRVYRLYPYRFHPVRGTGDKNGLYIGRHGIYSYIMECSKDPFKKSYRAHLD